MAFVIPESDRVDAQTPSTIQDPPPAGMAGAPFQIPETDRLNAPAPFQIPPADQQALAGVSLLDSKTPEQLSAEPGFRPAAFYAEHQSALSPEHEDKLAETLRLVTEKGLTGQKALEGVKAAPAGVAGFFKGGWGFLKSLPALQRLSTGDVGDHEQFKKDLKEAGEDLSALEAAGTSAGQLVRNLVRNRLNLEGPERAILEKVAGQKLPRMNADITQPSTFTQPVDWKQRLKNDAELIQQEKANTEAKGPIAQAAGFDAEALKKAGVEIDPQAIADKSAFENPINFIPFGEGLGGVLTTTAGKVLGKAISREAAQQAVSKLGGALSAAGKGIGVVGQKSEKLLHGVGFLSALSHGGVEGAAVAAAPHVIKGAGKALDVAGNVLKSGAVTPALNFAADAAKGAVGGAAAAAPFAAGYDDPSDITAQLATGATLGAAGSVIHGRASAAKDMVLRQAEKVVADAWKSAPQKGPAVVTPAYGTDKVLDAAHAQTTDGLKESNPALATAIERMRDLASSFDKPAEGDKPAVKNEVYALSPEQIDSGLPDEQKGVRGKQYVRTLADGTKVNTALVRLDPTNISNLTHETGHVLSRALPDEVRQHLNDQIEQTYGPQYDKFFQDYSKNAPDAVKNLKPGSQAYKDYITNEILAEHVSAVLQGRPLDGVPPGLRSQLVGATARLVEQLGLYKPDVAQPKGPGVTELGVKPSPAILDLAHAAVESQVKKTPPRFAEPQKANANLEAPPVINESGELKNPAESTTLPAKADPARPVIPGLASNPPAELFEQLKNQPLTVEKAPAGLATAPPAELLNEPRTSVFPIPHDERVATGTPVEPAKPPTAPAEAAPTAPESPTAPNLRGVSKKDYAPFTGEARQPVLDRVQAAVKAAQESKTLTDEQKQAVQTMADNLRVAHDIEYNSAKNESGMNRTSRREDIQAARGDATAREVVSKLGSIPLDMRTLKNGDVQVQVFSGDKVLSNVRDAIAGAADTGIKLPYTSDKDPALSADLKTYLANQDNGYRGDGQPLNRPQGFKGFIPDVNPDYKPTTLSADKADFMNMVMGVNPPETVRVNRNPVTKELTVPIQVRAKELAGANKRGGIPVEPVKEYKDFPGVKISDYNPLRVELARKGVPVKEMTEAFEWVNAKDIASAKPTPENKLRPSATDLVAAGFMPSKNPRAVKMAAVRDEDTGKVYEGPMHALATLDYLKEKHGSKTDEHGNLPPEVELDAWNSHPNLTEGFTTNSGEFLNREEAHQRAVQLKQYRPGAGDDGSLESQAFEKQQEAAQQFLPKANEEVRQNAEDYTKEAGLRYVPHTGYVPVNEPLAKRIADFYEVAKHNPDDPAVKEAYSKFASETVDQWNHITSKGVTMEPWLKEGEPYKNSAEMAADVKDNKHLYFFLTEKGFGQGEENATHPLLAETGLKAGGRDLLVNDAFRAVHDYFGHAKEGYEFGPRGELNAYLSHAAMYSKEALPAMSAETLGQNSWVNYGPHLRDLRGEIPGKGEPGYVPLPKRQFAEQKATVMPESLRHEVAQQFMPPKAWIGKDGKVERVEGDHADEALKLIGKPRPAQFSDQARDEAVTKAQQKGYLRSQVVDDNLFLEGMPDNFTSLPKAQRRAIEDMAIRNGLGLNYNMRWVEDFEDFGDTGGQQFMPKKARQGGLGNVEVRKAKEESLVGTPWENTDFSKYEPKPKQADKGTLKPKLWMLPNQELKNAGARHEGWLTDNRDMLSKRYGLDNISETPDQEDRIKALNKGLVRMTYEANGGRLGIEANDKHFSKAVRDKLFEFIADNLSKIDKLDVTTMDDRGNIKKTGSKSLFMLDEADRLNNLPLISDNEGAQFMPGPPTSPEFKKWFGKSKVVDEEGNPKRVFHGSPSDFSKFEKGDIGFHFGTSEASNDALLRHRGPGGRLAEGSNIKPVYIRLENPLRLSDHAVWAPDNLAWDLKKRGVINADEYKAVQAYSEEQLKELLKSKGYDGIVYLNNHEGLEKATELPSDLKFEKSQVYPRGVMVISKRFGDLADMPNKADAIAKAKERIAMGAVTAPKDDSYIVFDSNQVRSALSGEQFMPRKAERREQGGLFGDIKEYNPRAISAMNQQELRGHFPEAVVPRSPKESIPSEIVGSPRYKEAMKQGGEDAAVRSFADELVKKFESRKDEPETKAGARWYSEFTPMLKEYFGDDSQLFAELLAATSPQTAPSQNFDDAVAAFQRFKRGDYTKQIAKFSEGADRLSDGRLAKMFKKQNPGAEEPSEAALMKWWINEHELLPTKEERYNRAGEVEAPKFHANSRAVLDVLARRWLTEARGPKTHQFVQNLLGTDQGATIDLWADRTMREAGYKGYKERWRILPENKQGVSDEDFAFSQKAFASAAKQLKMEPSELQGALWFIEKKNWADQGWGNLDLGDFRGELNRLQARHPLKEDLIRPVKRKKLPEQLSILTKTE